MFTTKCIVTSALALSLVAGTTASIASAETAPPQNQSQQDKYDQHHQDRDGYNQPKRHDEAWTNETGRNDVRAGHDQTINPQDLCYFSNVKGTSIRSSSGDEIATISDLLVDRYSGRISGVVVTTGGVLGVGGEKHVVAPRDLSPTADRKAMTMAIGKAELKSRPVFDEDVWRRGYTKDSGSWWDSFMRGIGFEEDDYAAKYDTDRYPDLATGDRVTIKGEVASVIRTEEGGMQRTTIYVRDGSTLREIDLGPSWYIGASEGMPVRGDKVEVVAIDPGDNEYGDLVAASITRNGGQPVRLRDDTTYAPAWASRTTTDPMYGVTGRLVLASDLVGDQVMCRSESAGEVQDLVVDEGSHRVRMLVIDPNENFLGIADTTRLVPMNVALIASEDKLYIDATKQMVTSAPEAPDEASQIGGMAQTYQAFDLDRNAWGVDRSDARRNGDMSNGYGGVTVLTGKIVSVEEADGPDKVGRVCTVVIDDGVKKQRAIIAPSSDRVVVDSVKDLKNGDTVTVRTTAFPSRDGSAWMVVQTITDRNGKVVFQQTRSFASAR